jgi:hypothetical protein
MQVKNMSTQELLKLYKSLSFCLEELQCYGVQDLVKYQETISEIHSRGYEISSRNKLERV